MLHGVWARSKDCYMVGSQLMSISAVAFSSASIVSWTETLVASTSMDVNAFADDAGGTITLAFADNAWGTVVAAVTDDA